jgi:hypothetical protein
LTYLQISLDVQPEFLGSARAWPGSLEFGLGANFLSICWELICLFVYQVSCCLDLRFESSSLIAEYDRNYDISVFVVSYLLWLLLLVPVGNKEKCVIISRGSRETLYQDFS